MKNIISKWPGSTKDQAALLRAIADDIEQGHQIGVIVIEVGEPDKTRCRAVKTHAVFHDRTITGDEIAGVLARVLSWWVHG